MPSFLLPIVIRPLFPERDSRSRKNPRQIVPGAVYGVLTVLRVLPETVGIGKWKRRWECRCVCGTTRVVGYGALSFRPGRAPRHCSCDRPNNGCGLTPYDHTGRVFGKLTVLGPVEGSSRVRAAKREWVCLCECGNTRRVTPSYFHEGTPMTSCGCSGWKLAPGVSARNGLYKVYELAAKRRGHEWSLSVEQFTALNSANCHYCGSPPRSVYKGHARGRGVYVYNGVDRVNNDLGYTPENSVTCCKPCNLAKGTQSASEFLSWAARLAAHQQGRN